MRYITFHLVPSAEPGFRFIPCFFCFIAILFLSITTCSSRSFAAVPTVTTEPVSNVSNNSVTLHGIVNANGLSTIVWFQYRIVNGPSRNTVLTQTVIGTSDTEINMKTIELLPGSTYFYRIVARNDAGTAYGNEMSFTTTDMKSYVPTDIISPAGFISINNGAYCTNSLNITANLSAADNIGVTGYCLSTSPVPPSPQSTGWTSITPGTSYKEDVSYTLSSGDGKNTVYVWYKDDAGNISDRAGASVIVDTTPPTITITNPTSNPTYSTTSGTISISGSASDGLNEITSVVWSNSRGRSQTDKKAVGWTISNIDLMKGDNVITVKAADSVGNTGTSTITITYAAGDNPPKVITGHATSITTDLATLNGTVNAMGLPTTMWFQCGTSSGSYSTTSSIQSIDNGLIETPISNRMGGLLAGTTYYYRLAAQNSVGTAYGREMVFNTASPKGKIYGYVVYLISGKPVESVRLRIKGTKTKKKTFKVIFSDTNGFFAFKDLGADTYDLSVTKTGFKSASRTVELKKSEGKKVEIKLRKIKGAGQERDFQNN